ncbi:MAG: cation transporter [Chloroflexi bacterium]|nr:cation transporter [Chloroflexota bacterium]
MNTRQISFAIEGMFSANCAVTLERALTRLDGVIAARVNYATERATVTFDPARVSAIAMVGVAQGEGFDVPRQRIVLNVADLIYASSTRTMEKVLARMDGVAHVSVDLNAQQITLDVLNEYVNHTNFANEIAALGMRVIDQPAQNATRPFVLRALAMIALALLSLVSAGAHAGLFEAGILHAPLVVIAISVVIAYGIARRFYRVAFETVLLRGIFDVSVVIALVASAGLFFGLPLALLTPTGAFTSAGFIVSIGLTAGWFSARAVTLIQKPAWQNQVARQIALGLLAEPHDANPHTK